MRAMQKMAEGRVMMIPLAIYAICVALVSCLWKQPALLTGCYVVISIMLLVRWHAASDIIFYVVAFVLGPLGELFATLFGAWRYARPYYLIPIWLPFLWGIAILVVKNLSETLLTATGPPENRS
jgi:hypothetical protein